MDIYSLSCGNCFASRAVVSERGTCKQYGVIGTDPTWSVSGNAPRKSGEKFEQDTIAVDTAREKKRECGHRAQRLRDFVSQHRLNLLSRFHAPPFHFFLSMPQHTTTKWRARKTITHTHLGNIYNHHLPGSSTRLGVTRHASVGQSLPSNLTSRSMVFIIPFPTHTESTDKTIETHRESEEYPFSGALMVMADFNIASSYT